MQLRLSKIFLLFIIFNGLCNGLAAQAKFTAKVSPALIEKGETVELKLLVENATTVKEVKLPSLKNFIVLSGPIQETGVVEVVGGAAMQYLTITFILQPKTTGEFVITPSSAKADGKILHSNTVKIKVTTKGQGASQAGAASPLSSLLGFDEPVVEKSYNEFILKKGEKLYDKIKNNIFIKVETNKKTCFVGEPIVVAYKLYTRLKSESNIVKNPSFNDFSVIDLLPPGNNTYTIEKLDGRPYNVYILRKAQLYPLQAGPLGLEGAEVENSVHFVKEEYVNKSSYTNGFQQSFPPEAILDEKITLQSKPELILVKPLPEINKPASFAGAVGNFTIEAAVEKDNFTTEDAGKLIISIKGEGNLTLVNAPDIVWPQGLEGFEPKSDEELNKLTVPVSGIKYFQYPFSVSKPGSYTLPAVEFSFFDIAAGKYKTLVTQPLQVTVKKGTGVKLAPIVATRTGQEAFFDTIFTNRWMIIAPVALLIFIGLFVWLSRENKKDNEANIVNTQAEENKHAAAIEVPVKSPLAESEEKLILNDSKGFYETINKELKLFLANKLHLPAGDALNKKTIATALDEANIPVAESLHIQQLMEEIEWQLYAPFSDEDKMQEVFEKATALVHSFKNTMA